MREGVRDQESDGGERQFKERGRGRKEEEIEERGGCILGLNMQAEERTRGRRTKMKARAQRGRID
jgi:hypothetical protein